MKTKKIDNCFEKLVIDEPLELLITDSKTTISFTPSVKHIFVSSLINSDLIFEIEHDISILFLHNKGNSDCNITIKLVNLKARALIREVCLTTKNDKYNKNLKLIHDAKETFSDYKFFGFAIDESKLRISALSKIYKGMSRSEAHQMLNIITDGNARGEGQPGLLIDDYDVKASHGNSIGQVSDRDIYYLQTKGIKKMAARWMIIKGHVNKTLSILEDEQRNNIIDSIKDSLGIKANYE